LDARTASGVLEKEGWLAVTESTSASEMPPGSGRWIVTGNARQFGKYEAFTIELKRDASEDSIRWQPIRIVVGDEVILDY
jgi:hypothetical protein